MSLYPNTVYKLMHEWSDLKHFRTHEYVSEPIVDAVKFTTDGAVAPVKNQEQCNSYSSWIVSWSIPLVTMNNGFAFAVKNAMCTEASYSYTCLTTKGTCKASNCNVELVQGSVTRYRDVPTDSEQRF